MPTLKRILLHQNVKKNKNKKQQQQQQQQQRTNKETSKIKQQIRHDSTLEVNNTLFNDK